MCVYSLVMMKIKMALNLDNHKYKVDHIHCTTTS